MDVSLLVSLAIRCSCCAGTQGTCPYVQQCLFHWPFSAVVALVPKGLATMYNSACFIDRSLQLLRWYPRDLPLCTTGGAGLPRVQCPVWQVSRVQGSRVQMPRGQNPSVQGEGHESNAEARALNGRSHEPRALDGRSRESSARVSRARVSRALCGR
jgi:hypothetical protein